MRVAVSLILTAVSFAPAATMAFEASVSGYGTLGYAISDQPYTYQRFIDDKGTLRRDSLAGLQVDARFTGEFSATVQLKLAPDTTSDDRYEGSVAWAFVAYRPTNDWLIRLGKQRIPLYLYSETVDIGVTFDFARLPTEMYSIVTSNDFTGLSVGKTWAAGNGEVSLDGYWGKSTTDFRFWSRDDVPPIQTPGPVFKSEDLTVGGVVLSYRAADDTYRIGVHQGTGKLKNGEPLPTSYPFVTLAPGIGYYQVDNALPGPGVQTVASERATVFTLGADVALGAGWRTVGEWARTTMPDYDIAIASERGYVALLRRVEQWTPYVVYAFLRSDSTQRDFYRAVNFNRVPEVVPGAALINASQRMGADGTIVWDQYSWSVGTAYSFSPTSKIKAEASRVRVGLVSRMVDAPSGGDVQSQGITVFSLSYSVVF